LKIHPDTFMPGMPQVAAADVKTLSEWIAKGAN
jgi:hypothetical protein